jgi:hypothetical protein
LLSSSELRVISSLLQVDDEGNGADWRDYVNDDDYKQAPPLAE